MIADGTPLMTDVDSPRSIRAVNKYSTDRLPYTVGNCPPMGTGQGTATLYDAITSGDINCHNVRR